MPRDLDAEEAALNAAYDNGTLDDFAFDAAVAAVAVERERVHAAEIAATKDHLDELMLQQYIQACVAHLQDFMFLASDKLRAPSAVLFEDANYSPVRFNAMVCAGFALNMTALQATAGALIIEAVLRKRHKPKLFGLLAGQAARRKMVYDEFCIQWGTTILNAVPPGFDIDVYFRAGIQSAQDAEMEQRGPRLIL